MSKKWQNRWKKWAVIIVLLFGIIQLLPDGIVFSKLGRNIGLPTLVQPTNGLYASIDGKQRPLDLIRIERESFGLSGKGSLMDSSMKIKGEWTMFPQVTSPLFEFDAEGDTVFRRRKGTKFYPAEKVLFSPFVAAAISEHVDLLGCSYDACELEFEENKELYFFREKYTKGFLERQQVANGVHFKLRKGKVDERKCLVIEKSKAKNDTVSEYIQTRVDQLNDLLDGKKGVEIRSIFDMEYMCRFFLHAQITGKTKLHKMRWMYRLTNGKIYPIAEGHKANVPRSNKKIKGLWKQLLATREMRAWIPQWEKEHVLEYVEASVTANFETYAGELSRTKRRENLSQRELNYLLREECNMVRKNIKNLKKELISAKMVKCAPERARKMRSELRRQLSKIGASVVADEVRFDGGVFDIKEDLVLPAGKDLFLGAGTTLRIAEGKNIVVNGSLIAKGTETLPITITSLSEAPFGVVAAVGTDSEKSEIAYLDISNGSEAYVDGKFFSGALNVYHQDCTIKHSLVERNQADDGMNIKYASVLIEECVFQDNWADQIDLDFCTGIVKSSAFAASSSDSNGDGLDVSGSNIRVENANFSSFSDKGISIGEQSTMDIVGCTFEGNNKAIAAKDLSTAKVSNCVFKRNESVFALYRKKVIFGGAHMEVASNNEYTENGAMERVGEFSSIVYVKE